MTSITMNGGTLLRPDAASAAPTLSVIIVSDICYLTYFLTIGRRASPRAAVSPYSKVW
ncbi:MAG TPA: hypothetical protein VN130_06490 [Xanthobacteraceae bacterium]|nr:hypothetical protein [Xanthobacteraceae bacterium]